MENTIEEQDELLLKDINGKIDGVKKKSDNQAVEFTLNDYVDQMISATNIGKIDRWLILEVIKNISFEKREDIDKIKALLKSVVDLKYKGVAKRKVVYYIFNELSTRNDRKIVKEIIFELFIKNANTDSDTRKAILGALITQRNVWSQQVCLALLENYLDSEIDEKEDKRDISTRAIDKEKANRYEDNKAKKGAKVKKGDRFSEELYEGKLKDLKQVDKLSRMFNEQDGGMLDYYDLTTARGKKNKRKPLKDEERTEQKIFELSLIWKEAEYNFAFWNKFDKNFNWDEQYKIALSRVLKTKNLYTEEKLL